MARAGGKGGDDKLRRLPPGRHGLSREFVAQNQQERLIAGTIAAVAKHGFRETTVTQIAAEAGVSRRTFYTYFSTKGECFLATFDLFEQHLFATLEVDSGGRASWPARVRARVGALLELLEQNPDLVSFALSAPPATGGEVLERNRRLLERLVEALTEGAPQDRADTATSIERETIPGSLAAVLIAKVEAGDGARLGDASSDLVELVLAPFIGRRRAMTESRER